MSRLMRAPEPCASWEWRLDHLMPPGLDSAMTAAAQMSTVLQDRELLKPDSLEWHWLIPGTGGIGIVTRLPVVGQLAVSELTQRARQSQPVGFPDAEPGEISIVGSGVWFDTTGEKHSGDRLIELAVSPDSLHLSASIAVFHDIWGEFSFDGLPHPEVMKRNAPRLAAGIQAMEALLASKATPGDPTYFGRANGYGLERPDVINGRGPDLTDRL
jgi:hypothetical protein